MMNSAGLREPRQSRKAPAGSMSSCVIVERSQAIMNAYFPSSRSAPHSPLGTQELADCLVDPSAGSVIWFEYGPLGAFID